MFLAPLNYDRFFDDLTFIQYFRMFEEQKDVWEKQYREEGKMSGLKRGEAIGLEKGVQKQAIETACQLKKMGILSAEQIAEATGLTVSQIEELDCQ